MERIVALKLLACAQNGTGLLKSNVKYTSVVPIKPNSASKGVKAIRVLLLEVNGMPKETSFPIITFLRLPFS